MKLSRFSGDEESEDVHGSTVGASMIKEDILSSATLVEVPPLRERRACPTQLLEVEANGLCTTESDHLVLVCARPSQLQDGPHDQRELDRIISQGAFRAYGKIHTPAAHTHHPRSDR